MTIREDIQKLEPGTLVQLFEIYVGVDVFRFHAGLNAIGGDVVFGGQTYIRFPIDADGFELKGSGTLPRPRLRVANVTGLVGALVRENNDLVGCKVVRRRTFAKYLDAVNFPGGVNPTADPSAALPTEVYFVDRKSAENAVAVEFELASAMDVHGVRLPRRQVIQNVCTWRYRSAECGYVRSVPTRRSSDPPAPSVGMPSISPAAPWPTSMTRPPPCSPATSAASAWPRASCASATTPSCPSAVFQRRG